MSGGVGGPAGTSEPTGQGSKGDRGPVARFEDLLARERAAAAKADVEQLLALQPAKRSLLDELQRVDVPQSVMVGLGEKARLNVMLIRQLVQCLGGLVGSTQNGTYDAYGNRGVHHAGNLRGAL